MRAIDLVSLRWLPRYWQIPVFLIGGIAVGSAAFVFHVSRASSYLSDSPETCMNCHVMTSAYVTWQHSSHASVATCNDCHVPHDSKFRHYAFKAKDGMWHATVFTMRWEPQVIRLSEGAIPVVEENCRRCHAETVHSVSLAAHAPRDQRCWDCHRETPHGRVQSLSVTPGIFQPRLAPIGPVDRGPTIQGRPIRPQ